MSRQDSHKFLLVGQTVILDAQRSLYWAEKKMLFVSDVHLGKAGHFRKHGLAVPQEVHLDDLARLTLLMKRYKPEELVFLGDLFHSDWNQEWLMFDQWMAGFNVKFTLVIGNHDILPDEVYRSARIQITTLLELSPFSFTHEMEESGLYNLSGHVHPSVRLRGSARQGLVLPCFCFSENYGLMPAFGGFTGSARFRPKKGDRIFAVADGTVIGLIG